jgi:hypothetical protein
MDVTVQAGGVRSVVHTTEHHRFWDDTTHTWTDANQLHPGDHLHTDTTITASTTTTVVATAILPGRGTRWDLTVNHTHDFYVLTTGTSTLGSEYPAHSGTQNSGTAAGVGILVHNAGGMEGCSDAAFQGVTHIRAEIAAEGAGGSHSWAAGMSDDALADYLDGFVARGGGQALEGGGVGWYDASKGVAIIQKNAYSMTAYSMSYAKFLEKLG